MNSIVSLAASYVSYRLLCIEMCIVSTSVMKMHIPIDEFRYWLGLAYVEYGHAEYVLYKY